jgi:hypothetical protein
MCRRPFTTVTHTLAKTAVVPTATGGVVCGYQSAVISATEVPRPRLRLARTQV